LSYGAPGPRHGTLDSRRSDAGRYLGATLPQTWRIAALSRVFPQPERAPLWVTGWASPGDAGSSLAAYSAWRRSAARSSQYSIPTDSLTRPSVIPLSWRPSSDISEAVVVRGGEQRRRCQLGRNHTHGGLENRTPIGFPLVRLHPVLLDPRPAPDTLLDD